MTTPIKEKLLIFLYRLYTPVYMASQYMRIKLDGKWIMKPAFTPFEQYTLRKLCECGRCKKEPKGDF